MGIMDTGETLVAESELLSAWWVLASDCRPDTPAGEVVAFVRMAADAGMSFDTMRTFIKKFPPATVLEMIGVSENVLPPGLCASVEVEATVREMCSTRRFVMSWEEEILSKDFTADELVELVDFGTVLQRSDSRCDVVTTVLAKHPNVGSELLKSFSTHPCPQVRKLVARVANKTRYTYDGHCGRRNSKERHLPPEMFAELAEDDYVSVVFEVAMNRRAPYGAGRRARARLGSFLPSWQDKYCLKRWIPNDGLVFR